MEGETDLICQGAFNDAFRTFLRIAEPLGQPQGQQPQGEQPQGQVRPLGDRIAEGWRRALHVYCERTSAVAADVSANYEQLLVKTLDTEEAQLRRRTQQAAQALEVRGGVSANSAYVGTLAAFIVQGSAKAVRKAGKLAGLYGESEQSSLTTPGVGCGLCLALDLSVLAPTLAVIFVASVGVVAIGELVRNLKRAHSDDAAGGQ